MFNFKLEFFITGDSYLDPLWDYFLIYKGYAITDKSDYAFCNRQMLFDIFGKEKIIKKIKNSIDKGIKNKKEYNQHSIEISFYNFCISEEELFYYSLKYGKEPLMYYGFINET